MIEGSNYRAAATYIYHYAMRLQQQDNYTAPRTLRAFSNALLMSLNALKLCVRHQWLLLREDVPGKLSVEFPHLFSDTTYIIIMLPA